MSQRVCNILMITSLALSTLWISAAFSGCGDGQANAPAQVRIGSTVWDVDLAMNDQQRYDGLSGRAYLDKSVGMLFMYPKPAPRAYCMRKCLIPIDIAFIDSDLRIVKIYTMYPESGGIGRVTYPSVKPAQYALEVAGGLFAQKGVSVGDKVTFLGNIPDATKAAPGP